MLKNNTGKNNLNHATALDQLFYDVIEERKTIVSPHTSTSNSFIVDVRESESDYVVEAELPGFFIQNISVTYEEEYLSIVACKNKVEMDEDSYDYIRRERQFGVFKRNFHVKNVDDEHIKASYKHGLLSVVLPKIR